MKKLIIITLLAVCATTAFAQYDGPYAPDYKQIERNIKNNASNFNYHDLMTRYELGDSTMNIEEQRHLYFGYVFQPAYNPSDTSQYNAKMAGILNKQHFSEQDYDEILSFADALLTEDPFNLRALNAKLLVYAQKNNVEAYKKTAQKRNIVQQAIVSSGDGMEKSTPYYVIKVAHEYDILGFLGFNFGGQDKIERNCNCNSLTLANNRFGIEKMYFNIAPVLDFAKRKGSGKI
ncbi:DUF4919 domain-containing protein [Petrimonas sp.]|uniref:DUF4919 domain-containing protein n=1 Tax=Petrimonas sp. TaxID=2023866 RepID=UPI003F515C9E